MSDMLSKRLLPTISIHALPAEGDYHSVKGRNARFTISIHALPAEGDKTAVEISAYLCLFQSTPSPRRATETADNSADIMEISIHALPAEGDRFAPWQVDIRFYFNPRPPRGGRQVRVHNHSSWRTFQSTPSPRRATIKAARDNQPLPDFNPRPPREIGRAHV